MSLREDYLRKIKETDISIYDAYSILFINYIAEPAVKDAEITDILLKKFPNLYLAAPRELQDNIDFAKLAIKKTASDILSFKNGNASFEECLEFTRENPFVPTYCINLTKRERNKLHLEAFKNTDRYCFLERIDEDDFLEKIYLDIYFGKISTKNEDALKKTKRFIKTLKKEELKEIKDAYYT